MKSFNAGCILDNGFEKILEMLIKRQRKRVFKRKVYNLRDSPQQCAIAKAFFAEAKYAFL